MVVLVAAAAAAVVLAVVMCCGRIEKYPSLVERNPRLVSVRHSWTDSRAEHILIT